MQLILLENFLKNIHLFIEILYKNIVALNKADPVYTIFAEWSTPGCLFIRGKWIEMYLQFYFPQFWSYFKEGIYNFSLFKPIFYK